MAPNVDVSPRMTARSRVVGFTLRFRCKCMIFRPLWQKIRQKKSRSDDTVDMRNNVGCVVIIDEVDMSRIPKSLAADGLPTTTEGMRWDARNSYPRYSRGRTPEIHRKTALSFRIFLDRGLPGDADSKAASRSIFIDKSSASPPYDIGRQPSTAPALPNRREYDD